jgi:membrane protein implicated in regulation of membrane protease activity
VELLVQWYNIIFVAPVVLSAVYLVLSAMGMAGEHDADHDVSVEHDLSVEHDVDMDHDVGVTHDAAVDHEAGVEHAAEAGHALVGGIGHEAHDLHLSGDYEESLLMRGLSLLGFGKVPLSILVTCLLVIFGVTGLICNGLFEWVFPFKWAPGIYFWFSLAAALVCSFSLTGMTARGLSRIMPTSETYAIAPEDLVGRIGTVVWGLHEAQTGDVDVQDAAGDWHRVGARPVDGDIAKGASVILARYHRDGGYFDAAQSPL